MVKIEWHKYKVYCRLWYFYKMSICWNIRKINRILKEIKWDLWEAKSYGIKPVEPWYKRILI